MRGVFFSDSALFRRAFEHESLFERGVLVQRNDGVGRNLEWGRLSSSLIEVLHLDAFEPPPFGLALLAPLIASPLETVDSRTDMG
jgi:hypothetical protein